ncbi:MAG: class I SAM-dependent methyltransferase [Pseudomonadales bacterium]|nr:class I SAM-dependent methyltransferase [Pseudomonadales bacterium]
MRIVYGLILLCITGWLQAEDAESPTAAKIKAAVAHERRSEADKARDANRKPEETLAFFGLKDDMKVLELLPGGGWYTSILGPVLEEKGKLYVSVGAERVFEKLQGQPGFGSLELIPFDRSNFSRKEGERRSSVPEFSFGVKRLDMVLTFRNMHNFTAEGRMNLNKAAFDALKSGGVYGVVDHTRRHMQSDSYEVWRRMDPVQIIKEVEASGFEFVDFSRLHYRPDDELRYEVGRKTVTGNTDRFTLLFRKP